MDEAVITAVGSTLGTTHGTTAITYTPATADKAASISFQNGETKVEVNDGVIEEYKETQNVNTVERNGNIYIVKPDNSEVLLSDYPLNTTQNSLAVIRAILPYAVQIGIRVLKIANNDKPSDVNPAFYDPNDKTIALNGKGGRIYSGLSNKYNLINTLYHEKLHANDDKNGIKVTFLTHALIYFGQIKHNTFNNLPNENDKTSIINGMCTRLLNHVVEIANNNAENQIISAITEFNSLNNGYKLVLNNNFQKQTEYTITVFKGNTKIGLVEFDPNLKNHEE